MRLYLDTSVISAYYDPRTPERMRMTREFWGTLDRHDRLCSALTLEELDAAPNHLADKLRQLLVGFTVVPVDNPVRRLAEAYVEAGVVPSRYVSDAVHIAAAVVGGADVLVSWNFVHLVKRSTRLLVGYVNATRGLRALEILAPPEV
jgi:predicted nucleic acid-binding protein